MISGVNLILIAGCICLQGFFSGSEMVLLASNTMKLRRKAASGSKGARLALEMINNPRWYLATTSTGTNMFVIIASVITAVWFESLFHSVSEAVTIVVLSPFLLILGEIIPRSVFQQRATELAPKLAYSLWLAARILSPITLLVYFSSNLFHKLLGVQSSQREPFATKEELELLLDIPTEGSDVKGVEKNLIRRAFHLAKSDVAEVMVPLVEIIAVTEDETVEDALKKIRQTGFSRLPVYRNRIDNLIGIVLAYDLLGITDQRQPLARFMREVPYVPELKSANDLLLLLKKTHDSIAIVVDEYGGAVGIVTTEDILEEVVGDIHDEYDKEVEQYLKLSENRFLINARMEMEEANEIMNMDLPKEDYETLGGFLLKHMGRIPRRGETFIYRNIKFTIRRASKRSIFEIYVDILDDQTETDTADIPEKS